LNRQFLAYRARLTYRKALNRLNWAYLSIAYPLTAYLEWRRFNRIVSRLTWAKRGQAINRAYVRQLVRELEREWTG